MEWDIPLPPPPPPPLLYETLICRLNRRGVQYLDITLTAKTEQELFQNSDVCFLLYEVLHRSLSRVTTEATTGIDIGGGGGGGVGGRDFPPF